MPATNAQLARTLGIALIPAAIIAASGCSSSKAYRPTVAAPTEPAPAELAQANTNDGLFFRDPFAQYGDSARTSASGSSRVFPSTFSQTEKPGTTSSPSFKVFGDLPNNSAMGQPTDSIPGFTENMRQITFSSVGEDFDPTISSDGQHIYFSSTRHRPTSDIYVKSIDGTSVTQLTSDPAHDVMPSISPDGKRVAFASNRNGSWDIYVMNAEGGQAVQVTSDTAHELHPTWAPDGSTLAFSRLGHTSNRWEIWTVNLDRPSVVKFLTYGLFPSWQPGGEKILFQRSRDRDDRFFSLWTIDYRNGEAVSPTEIATSSVAAIINPSWSFDGSYVAFSTVFEPAANDSTAKPAFADIWIQRLDGSLRTNLTGGWFVNLMPTWSPDGRLFFISDRNGKDNIWSIGPEQAITAAGHELPILKNTNLADVPTDN